MIAGFLLPPIFGASRSRGARSGRRDFTRIGRLSSIPVISIVDDDESVRVATTRLLRLHGFVAHAFASAEEFLTSSRVRETSCLITDVRMPGMGGGDLQRHLIAHNIPTPIIFISAFAEESAQAKALEAGAVCFLTKPFDARDLIRCIDKALKA